MSVDRYAREYHLTPTGWKVGTYYYYGHVHERKRTPKDRLLTIIKEVEPSFGLSLEKVSWREKWRRPDSAAEIRKLKRKFRSLPTHKE